MGRGVGFSRSPLLAVRQAESQQPTDSSHFQPQVDLSNFGEVRKSGPATKAGLFLARLSL
jgi:hypothetical protein